LVDALSIRNAYQRTLLPELLENIQITESLEKDGVRYRQYAVLFEIAPPDELADLGFSFGTVVRAFRGLVSDLVSIIKRELKGRKRTEGVQVRQAEGDEGGNNDGGEDTLDQPRRKRKSTAADIEDDATTNAEKSKKREGGTYDDDEADDDEDRETMRRTHNDDDDDQDDGLAAQDGSGSGDAILPPKVLTLRGAELENLRLDMKQCAHKYIELVKAIEFDEKAGTVEVILKVG
jgi:hypothetical protein